MQSGWSQPSGQTATQLIGSFDLQGLIDPEILSHRTKPEEHEAYQELCGKLGVEEDEEEDEEDGDEDDMRIRGDLNGMCPLSGRPVSLLSWFASH